MPAPDLVVDLVKRFEENKDAYLSRRYNETELRRDFLDPFFEALGWDVRNVNNHSEKYRDVIHEQSVEVEGQAKSADYLFKIGDTPIFFVEAKKPSVDIVNNPGPAFQLKTYAWSKKLPLSLLTDFETLAFYECTSRPLYNAPPSKDRVDLYTYKDYITKWEEISGKISRNAVTSGAYDRYVQDVKGKHGTTDVDDDFLVEMERWRNELAHNIALRNPSISQRELNFAVQATIDRIIFLRICEDRGIETEGALKDATDGIDVYGDLLELFRKADRRYNSGLFHFSNEKGRQGYPDTLTPTLKIDDKVFKDILSNLYLPKSPYAFRYFSADILGQVYERFLGKVITLTPGHRAKVDLKPEVRKAGGVYYTPTFIVNYIVNNTVGEILKDKTPETMKSKPIRILDPACGSGSFLISAYQYLIDWYLDWYQKNEPAKWTKGKSPAIMETLGGWQLTLEKKKQILLDHIFGVDIDYQAVEVTKLSLLLKVVENPGQLSLISERVLPYLDENIKCGNSLIGADFFTSKHSSDEKERQRVNPFEWHKEFETIFESGGFDVVIGNPPYIRIQAMKEWAPTEVEFYKTAYHSASKGNYDIYVVFVEKGLDLLNPWGRLGFILPHKFFNAQYGSPLRELVSKGEHTSKIIHFGDQQVFEGATTYTALLFLNKIKSKSFEFEKVIDLRKWQKGEKGETGIIDASTVTSSDWNFIVGSKSDLFEKLKCVPVKLSDVAEKIFQGLVTGADPVFVLKLIDEDDLTYTVKSRANDLEFSIEKGICRKLLKGSEIHKYFLEEPENITIFPYKTEKNFTKVLTKIELEEIYPKAWSYLLSVRKILERREGGKWQVPNWWQFGRNQNIAEMGQVKILTQVLSNRSSFTMDDRASYCFVGGGNAGGYGVQIRKSEYSQLYFLGLLNSRLLDWYLKNISTRFRGGYYSYAKRFIGQLPIQLPSAVQHERMITMVDRMLLLKKTTNTFPQEKQIQQREIETTDHLIDMLVYELYSLSDEEIRIVEGEE